MMLASTAPVADWVTLEELYADPYPIYARLRREAPVAYVPALDRYLVTSYEAAHTADTDHDSFSVVDRSGPPRTTQPSFLNKDDPEHLDERRQWLPALRPAQIKRSWIPIFRENAERFLDELAALGPGADFLSGFAAPYVSENLRRVLGFENATHEDLNRWSAAMVLGRGNIAGDSAAAQAFARAAAEMDVALDEMIAWHRRQEDGDTIFAHLVSLGSEVMPLESIRANTRMTIGGGINEPRDVLGVATWALLQHPEQRAQVAADPALWTAVFDEALRWMSPIGLILRSTTKPVELGGVALPEGARLAVSLLSANRDETMWENADRFDIERGSASHMAFGKGTHVCAGSWMAKAQVADVGLPAVFERLDHLAVDPVRPVRVGGFVFRGLLDLPVTWGRS